MSERDEFHPTQVMPARAKSGKKAVSLKAYLAILTGTRAGSHYPLPGDRRTIIGRSSDSDIRIDDRDASRQHAALQPFGEDYYLMDMGSTNGTLVNGEPVEKRILRHSDKITVGRHVFQFILVGPEGDPIKASSSPE